MQTTEYTQENLKKIYNSGNHVLIKYKTAYELKHSKNAGYCLVPVKKLFTEKGFTKRGQAQFITTAQFEGILGL